MMWRFTIKQEYGRNNIDEQLDSELMKTVRMISIDIDRVADDTTREKLKR